MIVQSVYYQIIEYVIAPIGLMIFAFFVKGRNSQELRVIKLSDNAIESLLIASYSHLLYYFSLTAHEHYTGLTSCREDQFATLINAIVGLLTIFIFKYFYEKLDGEMLEKLKIRINRAAIFLMLFLAFIIVDTNMNCYGYTWTFSLYDLWDLIVDFFAFVIRLHNIIFIPFILYILYYSILKPITQINPSLKSYLKNDELSFGGKAVEKYIIITEDANSPIGIKISSYVKIATYYLQRKEYVKAMDAIDKAKKLATNSNYPESQLYGIRKIKAQLHCLLDQRDMANREVVEVEQALAKLEASDPNKSFYDLWINKLKQIIENNGA